MTCQRIFDPLDSLFAIELVTLSHNVRVFMRGFASADATRGQWKQTKSAVALWTPSPADTHVTGLYRGLGTKGTPSKFASVKTNKLRWGCEAVQRAIAKPSGRARRREIPASHAGKVCRCNQLNRAKGVKGGLRPFSSAPCGVQRRRLWWGLGQRPNCSSSNQFKGNSQQRAQAAKRPCQ